MDGDNSSEAVVSGVEGGHQDGALAVIVGVRGDGGCSRSRHLSLLALMVDYCRGQWENLCLKGGWSCPSCVCHSLRVCCTYI